MLRYAKPAQTVIFLALTLGAAAAHGGEDPVAPLANAETAAEPGFPWLCFVMAIGALGGLYYLVRRQEQSLAADGRPGRRPSAYWYCRACDRDVTGPECPDCLAPNPFLGGLPDPDPRPSRRRRRAV
jgi:hypothetical protein